MKKRSRKITFLLIVINFSILGYLTNTLLHHSIGLGLNTLGFLLNMVFTLFTFNYHVEEIKSRKENIYKILK